MSNIEILLKIVEPKIKFATPLWHIYVDIRLICLQIDWKVA